MATTTTTSTFPATMKASTVTAYGTEFSKTCQVQQIATPNSKDLKELDVLVQVKAAGVNPAEVNLASGIISFAFPLTFPCVMGNDLAGTVVAVGSKVSKFKIGDEVVGSKILGAHAEYSVIPEKQLAIRPAAISVEEAASVPVAMLTAYQSLLSIPASVQFDKEECLILGGSGGVGSWLILLAKHFFKYKQVYVTCSSKNASYVQSLGADQVIDYTTQDYAQVLKGKQLLAVFSTIGEYPEHCASILKPSSQNGSFVSIGGPPYLMLGGVWNMVRFMFHIAHNKFWSLFNYPNFYSIMSSDNGEQVQTILQWLAANNLQGKIRTTVMSLDDAAKAYDMVYTKRTVGKLVLKVQ